MRKFSLNQVVKADCAVWKKYQVDRTPLTNKNDKKAIKKLNAAQHLHEELYHQDVVGLEHEYEDKWTQLSGQVTKIPKVDSLPYLNTTSNFVPPINEVIK